MKSNLREAEDELVKVLADFAVSKDTAGNVTEDNIKDAISWYKQALGFHVEAGHGVKFTFTNIDAERPTREFSFTVHYGNDIYTLVDCNSQLDDMVQELNKTNDHFGFVRQMRDKFQKATLSGQEMNVELSPGITRNKLKLRCHGVLETAQQTTICCLNFI